MWSTCVWYCSALSIHVGSGSNNALGSTEEVPVHRTEQDWLEYSRATGGLEALRPNLIELFEDDGNPMAWTDCSGVDGSTCRPMVEERVESRSLMARNAPEPGYGMMFPQCTKPMLSGELTTCTRKLGGRAAIHEEE